MGESVINTNIQQINKIIAEFMGYEIVKYNGKLLYGENKYAKTRGEFKKLWGEIYLEFTGRGINEVDYPFDRNFSLLIPVIKRIEENGYVVAINGISCGIHRVLCPENKIIELVCGDLSKKTELTCNVIVQFIEWYNKNHQ